MSRSYRKPYAVDENKYKKIFKRFASKIVRRKNTGNGSNYKKLYCSYNINDYKRYYPESKKERRK